jgi:hypothetical protein
MKKIHICIAAVAALVLGSCNKFDEDINVNPNIPSKATGTQLIANAQLFLPGLSESPQGEFHAQYLAETQYPGASLYPDGGTSFYGLYQGPLMNLENVIRSSELSGNEGPIANQIAVAKILKAYFFWHITDRWGDVPYTDALKGSANFTPKYDPQSVIYDSLFLLLKDANAMIVPGNISHDIIYRGDMAKWKRLSNTIRLLMALRLSEVDATRASAEFNSALNADGGIMTSNGDNLMFKHLADAANQSFWYNEVVIRNREWWALTETLVNYMNPLNDPRLPVYGKKNSSGVYKGLEYGTTVGLPNTTGVSLISPSIYAADAPIHLVTYAQARSSKARLDPRRRCGSQNQLRSGCYRIHTPVDRQHCGRRCPAGHSPGAVQPCKGYGADRHAALRAPVHARLRGMGRVEKNRLPQQPGSSRRKGRSHQEQLSGQRAVQQ